MARQGKARVLTPKEIRFVFKVAELSRHRKRDIAMLHFSYNLALRACEIRRLRICDVLEHDGETLVNEIALLSTMTKSKQPESVSLVNKQTRNSLIDYLAQRRKKERDDFNTESPLFLSQKKSAFTDTSIIHFFENIYKRAGLKGAKSHTGRRSWINIQYYIFNEHIKTIQAHVRHKNTSTTFGYVDVDPAKVITSAERDLF